MSVTVNIYIDIGVRKTIYRKKQNPLGKSPEQITPENATLKAPRKANRPKEVILREKSEANKRRLVREEQKIERDLQRITNEQEKLLKKNTPKNPHSYNFINLHLPKTPMLSKAKLGDLWSF